MVRKFNLEWKYIASYFEIRGKSMGIVEKINSRVRRNTNTIIYVLKILARNSQKYEKLLSKASEDILYNFIF